MAAKLKVIENLEMSRKKPWKVREFEELKGVRTLLVDFARQMKANITCN